MHRGDCATFLRLVTAQPGRRLGVEWGSGPGGAREVDVVVDAIDRKWLLKDITDLIAQEDAYVLDIHSDERGGRSGVGRVRLRLRLRVADFGQFSRLLGKLDALSGVERARRA